MSLALTVAGQVAAAPPPPRASATCAPDLARPAGHVPMVQWISLSEPPDLWTAND